MVVNPLKGKNIADIEAMAKAKWASQGSIDAWYKAVKNISPVTTPKPTNVYWDVSGASSATKNTGTGVATATKWLTMKPEEFMYWEWAKQKETATPWYLQQRNDQLASDFYGKGMKDADTIRAELSKNAWFTWATALEQDNTIQGILNRMGSMQPTATETPTDTTQTELPGETTTGKYTDAEGNLVDILWYNDLPDDMKELVDWMSDAEKKQLDMIYGNDLNAKAEYLRQAKRDQEYLAGNRATTLKIKDLEWNILEVQSSQRLRDASQQVDNLVQNLWYLGSRWQPWKSGVQLQAAGKMIADANRKFEEMKQIETQVAQIRELWLEIDTAAYEKQMADISDDLNMKVGMQIQNAMNEMSAADMAGQLDTIDWVTQFRRSLLEKLDANISGYTEGSMKQMQYVTETYDKIAQDAQTRLTEWTKNANTVNTDMSTAMGYYVDWNGTPLYDATGNVISMPQKPPMEPVWDKESGQLITFSTDANGQIVANVQQVTNQATIAQQSANSFAKLVTNGTISMSDVPAELKWAVATAMANMSPTTDTGYQWAEVAPVATDKVNWALSQIEAQPDGSVGGQCGSFVNDYLQDMGLGRLFIDPIDAKKTIKNSDTPTVGSIAIMDSPSSPDYGHVGVVTAINGNQITIKQSNANGDETVYTSTGTINNNGTITIKQKSGKSYTTNSYGYFDPSKGLKPQASSQATAISSTDISTYNSSTFKPQTDLKTPQDKAKYAEFLKQKEAVMADKDADIFDILKYSAGGKDMTDTSIKSLEKFGWALDQLGTIQEQIKKMKTWPVVWRLKNLNPYDTDAQVLKAQLTALIPNLARWVYGEVGVLTDNDVRLYSQTIPNLTSTADVNKAILAMTLKVVSGWYKRQLQSLAAAGKDVSGFSWLYENILWQVETLETEVWIGQWEQSSWNPSAVDEFR